jgi:hypothetical protein
MKTINSRKLVMTLGGILIATLAVGCYGGDGGYSNGPQGYNSSYGSYGRSYPNSGYNSGYSYQRSNGNSYNAGYQNGVRADANRDRHEDRVERQHAVVHTEATHSTVDRDKVSLKDSNPANRTDRN